MEQTSISAEEYLSLCRERNQPLLDVRAPAEFLHGHFPDSVNLPILNDQERHEVGLCYKEKGQAAAVALAIRLTAQEKDSRIQAWIRFLSARKFPFLSCWRGGLRSRTAQEWLQFSGFNAVRLIGGTKALRGRLLQEFSKNRSGFLLTGYTGSGKTALLRSLKNRSAIDLEGLACHRGSAFGSVNLAPQPAQTSFENTLALKLYQAGDAPILLENESRLIGRVVFPEPLYILSRTLPRLILEIPARERAENLYQEYVVDAGASLGRGALEQELLLSLDKIRNRLGGLRHQELKALMEEAFRDNDKEKHLAWIAGLLRDYYDPQYEYAMSKYEAPLAFRGSPEQMKEFLRDKMFHPTKT